MATLLDLAETLERRAKALKQEASDAAVSTAVVMLTDLVNNTPVDTSRALSNWQIRLGSPVQNAIEPYFYGIRGSTQEQSAANALSVGKLVLQGKLPGQDIVISNVLPYIKRLNDGHSKQVPTGWVERAILLGRNFVKRL